jgi:hypothetical protein
LSGAPTFCVSAKTVLVIIFTGSGNAPAEGVSLSKLMFSSKS